VPLLLFEPVRLTLPSEFPTLTVTELSARVLTVDIPAPDVTTVPVLLFGSIVLDVVKSTPFIDVV
jgi:hypothetical protein